MCIRDGIRGVDHRHSPRTGRPASSRRVYCSMEEDQEDKVPIPPMERKSRPRLYHRKSRHGCWRCRQRRVKCDQGRPDCNNCLRHNVQCYYDRGHEEDVASPSFSIVTPRTRSIASSASPPILPVVTQYPPYRHLELLILHNFTVHTCKALTGNDSPPLLELWSVRVPKLAIAYEPLLNAVLAFSALHMLASPAEADPDALRACRGVYLENAVTHYRATIGGGAPLSPEVADATCFTSVLLLADALASVGERELEPYTPPSNWLGIGRGVRFVFDTVAKSLESTYPGAAVLALFRDNTIDLTQPAVLFVEAHTRRFPYLLEPRTADGSQRLPTPPETEETTFAYRDMASFLGTLQAAIQAGEPRHTLVRRLLLFATAVPNPFVEQLEMKLPKALIMLAHFWAMAARISLEAGGLWWIDAAPWREVQAMRRNIPMPWQHLLQWPLQVLADVQGARMKGQAPSGPS
ncbi:hypothetical protein GQ53DRAFT_675711 [Thozetella sp. PMI_491]|nr:hypothetical protein GQ53DRAFT_675711 [Thozetella sp. PMI_491]